MTIIALGTTLLLCALLALASSLLRLELRRHASRRHRPCAHELWRQDDGLLYIENVTASGVTLLAYDPVQRNATRWVDSWAAWNERLRRRVVVYTGRSAELAHDVFDTMWT